MEVSRLLSRASIRIVHTSVRPDAVAVLTLHVTSATGISLRDANEPQIEPPRCT
jgi:hypothetical protein